jgi:ADP-ribose pyrophosphatase YjhB (NUDIX family)
MGEETVSLNPALEEARFCPRCGSEATVTFPRSLRCTHCGYGAFYNPKPVACAITANGDGDILLLRRGFEPQRGKWSMPGGFVDLGESVEEAAIRETKEELNIDIAIESLVGVYSRSTDRIVVIVFAARTSGTPTRTEEALEVQAFQPTTIPWDQLAFWSEGRALRDYLHRVADPAGAGSSS